MLHVQHTQHSSPCDMYLVILLLLVSFILIFLLVCSLTHSPTKHLKQGVISSMLSQKQVHLLSLPKFLSIILNACQRLYLECVFVPFAYIEPGRRIVYQWLIHLSNFFNKDSSYIIFWRLFLGCLRLCCMIFYLLIDLLVLIALPLFAIVALT